MPQIPIYRPQTTLPISGPRADVRAIPSPIGEAGANIAKAVQPFMEAQDIGDRVALEREKAAAWQADQDGRAYAGKAISQTHSTWTPITHTWKPAGRPRSGCSRAR